MLASGLSNRYPEKKFIVHFSKLRILQKHIGSAAAAMNQPWLQLWMMLIWADLPACHFGFFFFLIVIVSWFCAARQVFPEESFMHISYSPKQDIENFQNSQKQNISGYHSISKYLNFLQMIIWNFHMIWSFKNQSLKSQTNVQVFRIATNKMPSCIPI